MIHEGLWDSLRRWHKNLRSRLNHRPFFDIKMARRNFLILLDSAQACQHQKKENRESSCRSRLSPRAFARWVGLCYRCFYKNHYLIALSSIFRLPNLGASSCPKRFLSCKSSGSRCFGTKTAPFPISKSCPRLRAFPDSIIVTCDDDQYYSTQWLHKLLNAHANTPEAIVAHRVYRILLDDNAYPLPYNRWLHAHHSNNFANPSMLNFA